MLGRRPALTPETCRWRSAFRSDELFINIKYVLDMFCEPYMQLFQVWRVEPNRSTVDEINPLCCRLPTNWSKRTPPTQPHSLFWHARWRCWSKSTMISTARISPSSLRTIWQHLWVCLKSISCTKTPTWSQTTRRKRALWSKSRRASALSSSSTPHATKTLSLSWRHLCPSSLTCSPPPTASPSTTQ